MFVTVVLQKSKYLYPPGQPFADTPLGFPRHLQFFSLKCTTALWSGKENFILTMHPFGQRQSKIIAVSGNVDQSKPDSHFNSLIDSYVSCVLIECVCSKMQTFQPQQEKIREVELLNKISLNVRLMSSLFRHI